MQQQEQTVPILRFPEFNGQWSATKVGNLFDNIGGTALESLVSADGEYKFISIGNYSKNGEYIDNGQRINAIGKAQTKVLKTDNLVMVLNDKTASGDIIGSTIFIDDDFYIYNQRSERLIAKKEITPRFAWCYLNAPFFRKRVFSISQGGTQIYVNFSAVKSLGMKIPSLEEQQKIAAFLGAVDEKIAQLQKKKDLLEDYKKGCMQKLFSQEIRFTDDNGPPFPDWEEYRIDDLFSIGAGGDIDKSRYSPYKSQEHTYPVFANSNENKGLYGYASYYKEEANCVTVSGRGHLGVPCARHERFVPIVRLLVLRPKYESDVSFYEAAISRINFFVESTGVPQLTGPQISSYKITAPTYKEQKKIADFLSAIDDKIALVAEELDKAKIFKKGLLQQMFV